MKRIRLIVAYDGTEYHGWQVQDNAVTVEEVLTKALSELLRETVEVIGASRTDAGVHAMGNVAVFDTDTKIPPEKIAIALNHFLPEDIRVLKSEETTSDFHPRYCDSEKIYEYRIVNTSIQIPVLQRYSYHVYHKLNVGDMKKAAEMLIGTHDFSAFCSAGSQVKSKIRTVYAIDIRQREIDSVNGGSELVIRIRGNGFLYNMVRIIAGTLIEVGIGRRSVDSVKEAVETGERSKAGPTAPAQGLFLMGIEYRKAPKNP